MSSVLVFSGLAVQVPLERVVFPMFREREGAEVEATFEPTTLLVERIRKGERTDVIVGVEPSLQDLLREGLLAAGSMEPLFTTGLGLAVPLGADIPRIDTLEAFVELLLGARSVAYSRAGASGIAFVALLEHLGIAEIVGRQATVIPSGYTATCLLDGRADVAVQQLSELRSVQGVRIVGPFPPEVQSYTPFAVAEALSGREHGDTDLVRSFRELLRTAEAREAYVAAGLEPSF